MERIIVVDQDLRMRGKFERLLINSGYRVTKAESGEALLEALERLSADLIIMEAILPGICGEETLAKVRKDHPRLPVIIMAENATTDDLITASKLGAFDYVLKPFADKEMLKLVTMALESGRFMRSPVKFAQEAFRAGEDNFVGRSQPMQEIYKAIGRVAPTDATVLIRGESGTGKELVARALYQHSKRVNRPFVIVNCVAIPESLLESELFGHEKGAFTDADRQRIGKIEHADMGTVFLDEIGDIPLNIQAKLLRLLQDKSIERIGGNRPIQTDVRIVAATNANLEDKIKKGLFREDLYYRINVVSLHLPPLKERRQDIPLLADYFMAKFATNLGVRNPGILPEASAILKDYDWPGNVRELANTVEKCLIFSKGCPVGTSEVSHLITDRQTISRDMPADLDTIVRQWVRNAVSSGKSHLLDDLNDHVMRLAIAETLNACDGNRSRAAKRLGISRPTLLYKLTKLGLDTPDPGAIDK